MFKKLIFIIPLALATLVAAPAYADTLNGINTETIAEPTAVQTADLPVAETTESPILDTLMKVEPGEIIKVSDDHCLYEGDIAIECPVECQDENGEFLEGCRRQEDGSFVVETAKDNPESPEGATDEPETSNSVLATIKEKLKEIADPETWPLILSAAALILTILLIIIINLIAHRKSRKIREEIER